MGNTISPQQAQGISSATTDSMNSMKEASGSEAMLKNADDAKDTAMEGAAAETASTREAGSNIAQGADGSEPAAQPSAADVTADANKNASA